VLINTISIATWNRNKVVATLAIIVLSVIVALHLHRKPFPLNPAEDLKSHSNGDW